MIENLILKTGSDDYFVNFSPGTGYTCLMTWGTAQGYMQNDKPHHPGCTHRGTLLKQTIEKSICKDCGEGKVLIRLKIQS